MYPHLYHNRLRTGTPGASTSLSDAFPASSEPLLFVVINSFMLDSEFILRTVPALLLPREGGVVVVNSNDAAERAMNIFKAVRASPAYRFCVPRLPKYGSNHAKFIVAIYPS